jgi:hypothetical protein
MTPERDFFKKTAARHTPAAMRGDAMILLTWIVTVGIRLQRIHEKIRRIALFTDRATKGF